MNSPDIRRGKPLPQVKNKFIMKIKLKNNKFKKVKRLKMNTKRN